MRIRRAKEDCLQVPPKVLRRQRITVHDVSRRWEEQKKEVAIAEREKKWECTGHGRADLLRREARILGWGQRKTGHERHHRFSCPLYYREKEMLLLLVAGGEGGLTYESTSGYLNMKK